MASSPPLQCSGGSGPSTESQPWRSMPIAGTSSSRNRARLGPVRLFLMCGVLLIAAVAIGTGLILSNLRERALSDRKSTLQNIALVLAEQTDRAFQDIDLVQIGLIDRIHTLGVTSIAEYERQLSGHDVHLMLKDKIASLPHVDAVMIINAQGKLINFSRSWPIPDVNVSDRDYFKALQSDPQLSSFVSEPVRHPGTGTWAIYFARKFVDPDGEFLGLVLGAIDLGYFERFFGSLVLGEESAIALFRRDGILLVRYPPRESPGRSYAKAELFTKILAHADRGVLRLTSVIDGKELLVAARSLAHYPIVVGVATTVAAALAAWRGAAIYMTGTAVLFILVIGASVLIGIKQFKNYELLAKARAEKDQKMQLDAALNSMHQGLQMYDAKGSVILTNQKYLKMYGLPPDAVQRDWTIRDVLHLRKAAGTLAGDPDQYLTKMIDRGKVETKVVELPDGRWISVTNAPVLGGGWVSTHDDVTERRRAEKELDRTRTFLNTIIENVPATIVVKDARDGRYVLINRYGEEFFGMPRNEMIGKNAYDFFPKDEADVMTARDGEVLRTGQQLSIENNPVHTPGRGKRLITNKRIAITGDNGEPQYLLAFIEDMTERKRAEERIAHLALHDALTDLDRKAAFTEHLASTLDKAAEGKESFSVVCIDLDRFKEVNDVFGHSVGDGLLREVSRRLLQAAEGTFLARIGGDEFTIIADGPQPSTAEALAECLLATVAGDLNIEGQQLRIGISVGVAIYPHDGIDAATLLANADAALYRAKAEGRGTIRFFEEIG